MNKNNKAAESLQELLDLRPEGYQINLLHVCVDFELYAYII